MTLKRLGRSALWPGLVADFGIALALTSAGSRMTETGMSLGTPHYMSPEQAMGDRELTPRSDVYALGAMTYEMLLGEAWPSAWRPPPTIISRRGPSDPSPGAGLATTYWADPKERIVALLYTNIYNNPVGWLAGRFNTLTYAALVK